MTQVRLSSQDRFLLAFEREDFPFNSYFYFESSTPFNLPKVRETFLKLFALEPQLNLSCDYKSGQCHKVGFRENAYSAAFVEITTSAQEKAFLEKHFRFKEDPPVRMASLVRDNKFFIIFSFHHPLFDGHAQINYLKDFFDVYHGLPYQRRSLEEVVHLRKYLLAAPLKWYFGLFKGLMQKKKMKQKISRFFDHEPETRSMGYKLLEYDKKSIDLSLRKTKLSSTAFFSLCTLRAFDKIQTQRGEDKNPIVIYIPKSLRFELKSLRAYQNLLGIIWMKFSRERLADENFTDYFRNFYKFRSSSEEIRKVIWGSALVTRLYSYAKLRSLLLKKETRVHDSSILVSSGRTPKEINFPEVFNTAKFYARGVMHRSPGIGVLVTSNDDTDFVCVEYLTDAFKEESIAHFCELLNLEITSDKFRP